jgi:DNA-binding NarL/FixJ family response regulator
LAATLKLNVAILTGEFANGTRIQKLLQSKAEIRARIIRDDPHFSLRSLRGAKLLVLNQDVSRERVSKIVRALVRLGVSSRVLLIIPAGESMDQVLDYLGKGIRAIILDSDRETDLAPALAQLVRGNLYLSPKLTLRLLHHFQELQARMRSLPTNWPTSANVCE